MSEALNTMRVLLVDDEIAFLETLAKRLRKRDVDAVAVFSGAEALAHLAEHPIDVVVLDMRMPEMDGLEALRRIKAAHPMVEVVMLTGHADLEAAIDGIDQGAFDYLVKPAALDDLLYKIQDAFQKKTVREARTHRGGEGPEQA